MKGIYIIKNTINGKRYYGSSVDISSRVTRHFSDLKNRTHGNFKLQKDYDIYGRTYFVYEVLERMDFETVSTIRLKEQEYLDTKVDWETDYNISPSSDCHKMSNETKEKISNSLKFTTNGARVCAWDIMEIRRLWSARTHTVKELAYLYGYKSHTSIIKIVRGDLWGKLPVIPRRKDFSKIDRKWIKLMYESGDYTRKQLKKLFCITTQELKNII